MTGNAGVAQVAEQELCKLLVAGSTPSRQHHDPAEWDKFHVGELQKRGSAAVFERLILVSVVEADKILELGTGLGANIRFLSSIGQYYGIEGSAKAVAYLHNEHPELKDRIALADFSRTQPFGMDFDIVVERASVPHNDITSIKRTLALVWASLKPGGLFISSDWFSTHHSEATRGETLEQGTDGRTATGFLDGQFAGIDKVHFSGADELTNLFWAFDRIALQERIERRKGPGFAPRIMPVRWRSADFDDKDYDSAIWDIIVRKPR